jgi:hypothetical protein
MRNRQSLFFYKFKHENGIKKQLKYAPAILSSLDLSFTIHSSQSQSHGTIPLSPILYEALQSFTTTWRLVTVKINEFIVVVR